MEELCLFACCFQVEHLIAKLVSVITRGTACHMLGRKQAALQRGPFTGSKMDAAYKLANMAKHRFYPWPCPSRMDKSVSKSVCEGVFRSNVGFVKGQLLSHRIRHLLFFDVID